jgi:hypothetical protein
VSELQRNVDSSSTASSLVIAGRLFLLVLAAAAAMWAFVFSGARERAPSGAANQVHVHGTGARGTAERDHAARGAQQHAHAQHHAHAHHGAGEDDDAARPEGHAHARYGAMDHDEAATGSGPAASPAFAVAESANPQDHKVIGTAQLRVFALSVRAAAWLETDGLVTAVLRNDELSGLSPGEHALFFRATAPAEGIDGRLTAEPPAPWDGSTSRVRFRFDAPASGLEPGEVGWVEFAARARELLVIPSSAVLYSPDGPYVLAAGGDGRTFTTRRVEIGRVSRGLAAVLSGLRDGEPIVVGSAFSWDAERRLQRRHEATAGVMP